MFSFLRSLARHLRSGIAAIGWRGLFAGASVVDMLLASVAQAWADRHAVDQQVDVATEVRNGVAAALDTLATQTAARSNARREWSASEPRETSLLPVPKRLPSSRSAIPDAIDRAADPDRYACLQVLHYTARLLSGPGTCPPPDLGGLNDSQRARVERVVTKIEAAPLQREMLKRLGWDGVDGWWWPHRQVKPQVGDLLRSGAGGGPAFRRG